MNLFDKVSTMVDGVKNLTTWLGSGGLCVSQEVAQSRADICNYGGPERRPCHLNRQGGAVTQDVALATKKFLEFKNNLELRVNGEKSLYGCAGCGCVLRLMVWEPQDRVKAQMSGEEIKVTP